MTFCFVARNVAIAVPTRKNQINIIYAMHILYVSISPSITAEISMESVFLAILQRSRNFKNKL